MRNLLFPLIVCATLCGCHTSRQFAAYGELVESIPHVTQDSILMARHTFDSIYIDHWHSTEYHPATIAHRESCIAHQVDTVFIKDVSIEHRYRVLRDTIRIHEIDSIPVIKPVEVIKTEKHLPRWSKALNWIGIMALLVVAGRLICLFVFKR